MGKSGRRRSSCLWVLLIMRHITLLIACIAVVVLLGCEKNKEEEKAVLPPALRSVACYYTIWGTGVVHIDVAQNKMHALKMGLSPTTWWGLLDTKLSDKEVDELTNIVLKSGVDLKHFQPRQEWFKKPTKLILDRGSTYLVLKWDDKKESVFRMPKDGLTDTTPKEAVSAYECMDEISNQVQDITQKYKEQAQPIPNNEHKRYTQPLSRELDRIYATAQPKR